jgi:hypothetical protein
VGALVVFVCASLRVLWVIARRGEWRAWRASCAVRSRASLLFKQWKRSWKRCASEQHQQIFHRVRLLCSDRVHRRSTGGRHSGFTLTGVIALVPPRQQRRPLLPLAIRRRRAAGEEEVEEQRAARRGRGRRDDDRHRGPRGSVRGFGPGDGEALKWRGRGRRFGVRAFCRGADS